MNAILANDWRLVYGTSKAENINRALLTDDNRPLVTLSSWLDDLSLRLSVGGLDRSGTLALVTGLFARAGVSIVACYGQRLHLVQGCHFELEHTPENSDRVRRMLQHLQEYDWQGLRLLTPLAFDRVYRVRLDIPEDVCGLLYPLAKVLADHRVNLRSFSAEKEVLAGLGGLPEVRVLTELEVPSQLDLRRLLDELTAAAPAGSRVTVRETYPLADERPVQSDGCVEVNT